MTPPKRLNLLILVLAVLPFLACNLPPLSANRSPSIG